MRTRYRIAFQGPMGWSFGDVYSIEEARDHARRLLGTRKRPGDAYGAVEIKKYRDGSFIHVESHSRRVGETIR